MHRITLFVVQKNVQKKHLMGVFLFIMPVDPHENDQIALDNLNKSACLKTDAIAINECTISKVIVGWTWNGKKTCHLYTCPITALMH